MEKTALPPPNSAAHAGAAARGHAEPARPWALVRPALMMLLSLTLLTGVVYPALVTALAQLLFPDQASGSLIRRDGAVVGSRLIGQAFADPKYFFSRPSGTAPAPYDGRGSTAANVGPTNPALTTRVSSAAAALAALDPAALAAHPVPVDLVTASGSGLDPHISPAAAYWQVARVARARRLPELEVQRLVERHVEGPSLGVLGAARVNVLELNLDLDLAR